MEPRSYFKNFMEDNNSYKKIYTKAYFHGEKSFFYKLGYRDFRHYFNNLFKPLKKHNNEFKAGNVLDVGCAYGFMLKRFPDNFTLYGIDISEYAILRAKKIVPQAVLKVGNIEEGLPFNNNFFDIVCFNDVIEHLRNPQKALLNIKNILKTNGLLYITTPNLNLFRKTIYFYADKKEHHISLFARKKLIKLLKFLEFEILEEGTYFSGFIPAIRLKNNIGPETFIICKKI